MKLAELIENLRNNNVPAHIYSLNEGEKLNAFNLTKIDSGWEYFFMSERGEKTYHKIFHKEEEAFNFFWKEIKIEISVPPSKPPDWGR